MNILEIVAARRTGQHAIISWLVKNLTNMNLTLQNDGGAFKMEFVNEKLIFWNDANLDQEFGLNLFKGSHLYGKLENLIINYEDTKYDYSFFSLNEIYRGPLSYNRFPEINVNYGYRLLLIRNFYNCLASRYNSKTKPRIDNIFIDIWKNNAKHVLENPKNSLKFEDWLSNTEKRKQILFDYFKITERYTPNDISGRKSSFETNDYNNRFDSTIIPDNIKQLIRKDTELHYLIGALGYEYKEI